ncbi:hypothetical protein [Salinicoccus bachuensis]|uniref:Uncharacterized protein n=1 Tax=Salinicoccus bachuensis TaxID=3136731 RepID=A0ABZ3CKS8_9STAP
MFETFDIGNISIPSVYMAILLSFIVTYLMLWESEDKKRLFNEWTNAIIILFLVYKLTYIPFNWPEFIDNPMSALYFDGGAVGLLIALVVTFVYLFYQSRGLFYVEAYCIFSVSLLAFYGVLELRALLQWHYIALAVITLAALVLIYFMWRRFRAILFVTVTIFIVQLLGRFFIYSGPEVSGISIIQWWIIISLIYVLLSMNKETEGE